MEGPGFGTLRIKRILPAAVEIQRIDRDQAGIGADRCRTRQAGDHSFGLFPDELVDGIGDLLRAGKIGAEQFRLKKPAQIFLRAGQKRLILADPERIGKPEQAVSVGPELFQQTVHRPFRITAEPEPVPEFVPRPAARARREHGKNDRQTERGKHGVADR